MKFSQKQIIIVAGVAALMLAVFVLVATNIRKPQSVSGEVSLKIWGTDSDAALASMLQGYQQLRPGAKVEYKSFDASSYGSQLLNALASGEGPDVFYIGNHELPRSKSKLTPVDAAQFGIVGLRDAFPTVVEQDFVSGGQIYALPLYLDTMALFYNKDYFDQAGVVAPPKTWNDFRNLISPLRSMSPNGQIEKAAAAIGGSERSVDSAIDLLALLMLQNGTKMTSPDLTRATFSSLESSAPGFAAFNFYLQFANAGSPYYTWNDGEINSIDSFAAGKTAMIFNYQSAASVIKNKSPFLNFGIAPMPQVAGAAVDVNYPRYYGLAVSKQSKASAWAWDLVIYLTTNADAQNAYMAASGHPPALRALISGKLNDPDFTVFARQSLTARSWYEADDKKINGIFNGAIQDVLNGRANSQSALSQAEGLVSQLMKQ